MPPYVLDTDTYIRAFNDQGFAARLISFHHRHLPNLWVSAVVLFELFVGALDERREQLLERTFLRPFGKRGRILSPGVTTWRTVARMERDLRRAGGVSGSLEKRAFLGDMLIAASCREVGATLITGNARDFTLIRRVLAFRSRTELPEGSAGGKGPGAGSGA